MPKNNGVLKYQKSDNSIFQIFSKMAYYLHDQITQINQSKIFAGIIIITLNISSKYVNLKISKTVESYLKHTFSRDILVFSMSWMGTRDIYISLIITSVFILLMDFVFNEESRFCCLPEQFTDYHISLLDTSKNSLSPDEIKTMEAVLEKAKNINNGLDKEKDKEKDKIIPSSKFYETTGSIYNM
jgi:hypothetical protein